MISADILLAIYFSGMLIGYMIGVNKNDKR